MSGVTPQAPISLSTDHANLQYWPLQCTRPWPLLKGEVIFIIKYNNVYMSTDVFIYIYTRSPHATKHTQHIHKHSAEGFKAFVINPISEWFDHIPGPWLPVGDPVDRGRGIGYWLVTYQHYVINTWLMVIDCTQRAKINQIPDLKGGRKRKLKHETKLIKFFKH